MKINNNIDIIRNETIRWKNEILKLKEMIDSGLSISQISKEYNVSSRRVIWACNKYNLRIPKVRSINKIKRTVKIDFSKEIENIKELVNNDVTSLEIGKIYNYSRQMIDHILRKYNIKRKTYEGTITKDMFENRKVRVEVAKELRRDKEAYHQFKLFSSRKARAKYRGILFTIKFHEIEWNEYCPMLGIKLDYHTSGLGANDNTVSFDKIDPTKGYISGNVVVCSYKANRIKNNGTLEDLKNIVNYLTKLNENKSANI